MNGIPRSRKGTDDTVTFLQSLDGTPNLNDFSHELMAHNRAGSTGLNATVCVQVTISTHQPQRSEEREGTYFSPTHLPQRAVYSTLTTTSSGSCTVGIGLCSTATLKGSLNTTACIMPGFEVVAAILTICWSRSQSGRSLSLGSLRH